MWLSVGLCGQACVFAFASSRAGTPRKAKQGKEDGVKVKTHAAGSGVAGPSSYNYMLCALDVGTGTKAIRAESTTDGPGRPAWGARVGPAH